MKSIYIIWSVLLVVTLQCLAQNVRKDKEKTRLPPCRACRVFVDSFKKGLERTAKYRFEGGDTAWEEEKLGSYATSEIRFVEIHEKLCSEVIVGKDHCYVLLEEYDEVLENWWFKLQKDRPDLLEYLCIDTFKVCCPDLHFGRDCTPCKGYPDKVCNNSGKCRGSGTRKGNGTCQCDVEYVGEYCEQCADNYYESYRDEKKLLCSRCHASCDGKCTKAGPEGCEKCKLGFLQSETGCADVNECLNAESPCSTSQFCVNAEGSYRCLDCDKSCDGCRGDGPDECVNCAPGYKKRNTLCVSINTEDRKLHVSVYRYLTYLGLCVCTYIVSNKNMYLAAFIGLCVALYIAMSEYVNSGVSEKGDVGEQLAEQIMKSFKG
ncbi:cysteine-rich with EGF-like domain protein 2 [Cylas formicarius]|uniref:cysteine-rich with EGF-like domain protein 2 n=1 Tax=Cylas formicarius TaxID=197179 RepID=UPI0029583A05|nr:cysteine-rich with EGF-like domain protein 2 [Cylas formicarius]